ncbi:tripartite tricarboxylate transporter substrate binding protein [Rhizobium halophytocola]|uniref:Tripartite-type tricarboxylate transporter receptor subunit TctC n=1 Tax=Rhizobium halophytocola TaxID=735519 RepID=A0ABS4DU91_9HYPH|nr:tripartite tricarboxylate transporter substrate binding protein [Rhizobium halophytocola]MBP1849267.1 tripartite-type tricarboxylate transporter receptor subunit TctC [Rhizobium halophytocola]
MPRSTSILLLCATALASVAVAAAAQAADKPAHYPTRPINFVVPYPPGGGVDLTARTLATQLQRMTNLQFRVENRAGGGSVVGNAYVAKQAKPDGYTIDVMSNPTMAISVEGGKAPFGADDLQPIAGITFAPTVWLSNAKSKIGKMDFKQIIEYAKAHPGELKVGVIPNGAFDIATRIVQRETGAKFTIVPFQGGKPAAIALLGGNIDIAANYYDEVAQYVDAGDMIPLAVADNTPLSAIPDVPTMKDVGIKMESGIWGADRLVAVNPKVPDDIKAYLSAIIQDALHDKESREAFEKVGIELMPLTAQQEQKRYDVSFTAVKNYYATAK